MRRGTSTPRPCSSGRRHCWHSRAARGGSSWRFRTAAVLQQMAVGGQGLGPGEPGRQLEQQRHELPGGEPQQEHADEPEQQLLECDRSCGAVPAPDLGPPASWKDLAGEKEKVTRDDLAAFYRRSGFGIAFVAVGRPQSTKALTTALLKALDADGNGTVSEAEWKAAPRTLAKLDRNDDELVGAGELVPRISYPGAGAGCCCSRASLAKRW